MPNLEVFSEVFMVVGDCLRVDKNDTALGGSIFLNNVVAKKFLPRSDYFEFQQDALEVATTIDFLAN
ncbi:MULTISPECIES: hypothetical protein [unclassified Microcoleus]|uniref:hypothetical protein n=2 Tax=unclassified Microcoleus TaxID=2642155 RepID=UPI002FD58934